jgi:hypothetical protein
MLDSLTSFPLGWLSACAIGLAVERASNLFLRFMQILIRPTADVTDYFFILYVFKDVTKLLFAVTVIVLVVWISATIDILEKHSLF